MDSSKLTNGCVDRPWTWRVWSSGYFFNSQLINIQLGDETPRLDWYVLCKRDTANGQRNGDNLVVVATLHPGLHLHLVGDLDDAAQVEAGGRSGRDSDLIAK